MKTHNKKSILLTIAILGALVLATESYAGGFSSARFERVGIANGAATDVVMGQGVVPSWYSQRLARVWPQMATEMAERHDASQTRIAGGCNVQRPYDRPWCG